jgi:tetratricopeptide (TPR) repeat protein
MKRHIMTLAIVGLLVLAITATAAVASTPDSSESAAQTLAAANQLLEAGHIDEAIQIYEQLVRQGVSDSALFYNLGNAYLSQGNSGQALLNYQQAALLDPRDADIRFNLALAQEQAPQAGATGQVSGDPWFSLARLTQKWLAIDELALLALGAWFMLGLLLLVRRQRPPTASSPLLRAGIGVIFLFVVMLGLSLFSRLTVETAVPAPVIATGQVAVPSSDFLLSQGGA